MTDISHELKDAMDTLSNMKTEQPEEKPTCTKCQCFTVCGVVKALQRISDDYPGPIDDTGFSAIIEVTAQHCCLYRPRKDFDW